MLHKLYRKLIWNKMLLEILKSKIHRAKVTQADLNYIGSITIDGNLTEAAGLYPNEKVAVVNLNNGERIETYVIVGEKGSGKICLNGAAAHKFSPGDLVIIMSYAQMTPEEAAGFKPKGIFPDSSTNLLP